MEHYIILFIGVCTILFTITAVKSGWIKTTKIKNKSAFNIGMAIIMISIIMLLLNSLP